MMLRTILLIIGVVIILAIAIDGWRRKRRYVQFSRAVDPTNKFTPKASYEVDTVSSVRIVSTANPAVKPSTGTVSSLEAPKTTATPATNTRQQLAFPELEISNNETAARDPKDLEIQTMSTSPSANDISSSRPSIKPGVRPEQVKSANQAFPAHERSDNNPRKKVEAKMPEVITLTVMSINSKPFIGYDLIRALEANNLHFGEMNIYHRHKYRNGKGPLYFSVASVTRPGTLDPKNLSVLSTPGLALFMQLDNPKHDRIIFKQMLATAHDLAKALNGAVCDDRRVPLRESTIQGYNEKLNL
jgi:cell division protein ZipA